MTSWRDTQFAPVAGPYRRRNLAARALMRVAGLLLDTARWLLGPRP